jgi:hypothetical protein
MPIAPLRNLSEFGIIADVDPYNLPPNAFSGGVNVRFVDRGVQRAPVFRNVDGLAESDPRFLYATSPASGFDTIIIGYKNGKLSTWSGGTETDASIAAYATSDSEAPYSALVVGDVVYVNREDRVPWFLGPSDSDFQELTNWTSTWRARTMRACGGALVALNVTKNGVSYPTMVKTSEFATYGSVPSTWDETDPTNNATENVLNEMEGPIVDGWPLGNNLFIYGENETWLMQADGSNSVFRYARRFKDAGLINANCVQEIDNKHVVFGRNDIWMHDGTTKVSLCSNRVRNFIFRNIDISEARRCFVFHNEKLKEIYFCYVSGDRFTGFTGGTGCNRAAVFSYAQSQVASTEALTGLGVWTFYDLPFVHGAATASLDTTLTYETVTATYETIGATYLDQEDSLKKATIMVGDTYAAHSLTKSLYAFDLEGPGSMVPYALDANATLGWQLERDGLDLDELGVPLRGYKVVNSVYPQARLASGAEPIEFAFGGADFFNVDPEWSDYQTYDGNELYKLDYRMAGRYLAMRIRHDDTSYVNFSGLDFDIDLLGER